MTQDEGREELLRLADEAHWNAETPLDDSGCVAASLDAVLSAPPGVLAAALPDETIVDIAHAAGFETRRAMGRES